MAFKHIGISLEFKGEGENEVGIVISCSNKDYQLEIGKEVIAVSKKYFRPTEVDLLIGDPTKAKEKLGWVPEISLEELIDEMMESDLKNVKKDLLIKDDGFETTNYFEE